MHELVSIVTTVFNGSNYFDRAIPSILSQSYKHFEWIIVDDGSTDDTLVKLQEIEKLDNRIRIIHLEKTGRTKALNYAISLANSEYIFQQDFDDVSHNKRIELQYNFMKKNPNIGLVGGYYEVINYIRNEKFLRKPPLVHNEIKNAMAKYIPICHTIAAFRKQAWKDVGGYNEEYNDIIDLRFYIEVINLKWLCANIPENLGIHFIYSSSNYISANSYRKRQQTFIKLNMKAIKDFKLSRLNYFYVAGRLFYYKFPPNIKMFIRRKLGISKEETLE